MLTKEPCHLKIKDYFSKDFTTIRQLIKWCENEDGVTVKKYIIEKLKDRIEDKQLKGLQII